jgi:hypothetical protein
MGLHRPEVNFFQLNATELSALLFINLKRAYSYYENPRFINLWISSAPGDELIFLVLVE